MSRANPFPELMRAFFCEWLVEQRNASIHTVRSLYVAACSAGNDISPSSKESGESHASLRSTNLCGR